MKKVLFVLFISLTFSSFAKKVKFAVDMSTYTISTLGIHVMGDFQAVAGYTAGDFSPGSTLLTQEGSTTIYSIIVDIPAFRKYEYRFVNGDQSYEAEFVPEESRVGYNFDDNRWLYVDSLANDTTFAGAVIFAANAPAGKKLIRCKVDMSDVSVISPKKPHLCGSFQGWDPTKTILYSFGANVFEVIYYVTGINYEYKFCNGNTLATYETVPAACVVNGNRSINVPKDTVPSTVCFSSCSACNLSGIADNVLNGNNFTVFPNPAADYIHIKLNGENHKYCIRIYDLSGRLAFETKNINETSLKLSAALFERGIYFISVNSAGETPLVKKLIIE